MKIMMKASIVFIGILLMLTGCKKKDTPTGAETEGVGDLLLAAIVGDACFVSTVSNLEQGTATNKKAVETVQSPDVWIYGDMVLMTEVYFGGNISRYDRADGGELSYVGKVTVNPASLPIAITFASATKAYVSLSAEGKLAVINPTDMTLTKYIDLSGYAVGDNNPDPTSSVIRDGKLFVGLKQGISMFAAHDSAFVLIIDVATDSVEKMIIDDRTCAAGFLPAFVGMFVDDVGDLYVYCTGGYNYQPGSKDGFLRIKKGETEFDPGYFFSVEETSLPDVPDNKGLFMYNPVYTGGSTVYGSVNIPAWQSSPPDYVNDRTQQPFKFDLIAKTAEKIDLNPSSAFGLGICEYKNKIVFGMSSVDGDGLYTYDMSTGKVSTAPVVKTTGTPLYILAF